MENEDKRSKLALDAWNRKAGPHKDMKYDKKIVRKLARKEERISPEEFRKDWLNEFRNDVD